MDMGLLINLGEDNRFAVQWVFVVGRTKAFKTLKIMGMIAVGGHWNCFWPVS
jgi:hypothetical protein